MPQITAAMQSWRRRGSRKEVQTARDGVAASSGLPSAPSRAAAESWGPSARPLVRGCPPSMPESGERARKVSQWRRPTAALAEQPGLPHWSSPPTRFPPTCTPGRGLQRLVSWVKSGRPVLPSWESRCRVAVCSIGITGSFGRHMATLQKVAPHSTAWTCRTAFARLYLERLDIWNPQRRKVSRAMQNMAHRRRVSAATGQHPSQHLSLRHALLHYSPPHASTPSQPFHKDQGLHTQFQCGGARHVWWRWLQCERPSRHRGAPHAPGNQLTSIASEPSSSRRSSLIARYLS